MLGKLKFNRGHSREAPFYVGACKPTRVCVCVCVHISLYLRIVYIGDTVD